MSPTPRETTLQNILRRKLENKEFLPPPKQFTEINPSWSGTRLKRKFLRKMDKVFHGINFLGMIEEEEVQYPECQLPPPEIGEYPHVDRLFGETDRNTPTDKDRTVLPTDFNEMTTEYTTESFLDYQNCCLVIENVDVENVDFKTGQLLAGRNSLTGTVPKRNKNDSSVPKGKIKFETKNRSGVPNRKMRIETNSEVDYVWNAGERENMDKNLTLNKRWG